jgi:nitrous oxide reductase accessory protein NosL
MKLQTPWRIILSGWIAVWILSVTILSAGVHAASSEPVPPGPGDKCPVCGMFVAKYPDWVAQVAFRDGLRVYFDGAKDLFKYLFGVSHFHPGRARADIQAVWVTGYYTITPIDATRAFYVEGSDVYGPMGRELIPFATEADAREFLKDHKGRRIFRFSEITTTVLKALD